MNDSTPGERLEAHSLSRRNKLARLLWTVVSATLFRFSPRTFHGWRRTLLALFGARVGSHCLIYGTARIWAPWNLDMSTASVIGDDARIYNVARIYLGEGAVISQGAYLCTATHDYRTETFDLVAGAISIREGAWVATDAFIGPGVTVGRFSIVSARAVVTRDIDDGVIAMGVPARVCGPRARVEVPPGYVLSGYKPRA